MQDHPSAMLGEPGPFFRLLATTSFSRIVVRPEQVELLRALNERGSVVYIFQSQSILDYLLLNWLLRREGLPLCRYAVGVRLDWFRPLGDLLGRLIRRLRREPEPPGDIAMKEAMEAGQPICIFLQRPQTLTQRNPDFARNHFAELLQIPSERSVLLVPIMALWRPRPQRLRPSIFDVTLGTAAAPGRIRKLWAVLLSAGRARLHIGQALALDELKKQRPEENLERLARKAKGALHIHFARQSRIFVGPKVKPRDRLIHEIVRGLEQSEQLSRVMQRTGKGRDELLQSARDSLDSIAADFRLRTLQFIYAFLQILWNRIYDGLEIDEAGFEAVSQAAHKGPVVLLPSHKSHVDYLVLSWLFHGRGLMPPHIAAGDNLNFFPIGTLLRQGGAIFMKRSFRGNPLYAASFSAYVKKLLREGYNIEFFIEGGRSRTGKILTPKLGLLSYIVDAVIDPGGARDVHLVPVTIGYERIVEQRSYEQELGGARKKRESASQLLAARKVLRRRYGRLHVIFDEPFSLKDWLETHDGDAQGLPADERAPVVRALAHRVATRLTRATPITSVALMATVALCNRSRGLRRSELQIRAASLQRILVDQQVRFSTTVEPLEPLPTLDGRLLAARDGAAVDEALADAMSRLAPPLDEAITLSVNDHTITRHDYDEDTVVYTIAPDHRIRLEFYRNAVTPILVGEAIVACTLLADAAAGDARWLSHLLRREFIYPVDASFEDLYAQSKERLTRQLLLDGKGAIRDDGRDGLSFYRELISPLLDAYHLTAQVLSEQPKTSITELIPKCEQAFLEGRISRPEAASTVTLANARTVLRSMEQEELLDTAERLRVLRGPPP